MNYNHVAVFVHVVRTGGFSAAAKALGIPKSSVSRTVALLEQEMKVRLLQRTTRAVTPTEAGLAFYEAVKQPVGSIDEADALAREHGGEPRGLVRISVAPEYGVLPQTIAQFVRKYPGIQVEVAVSSRFVDLVAEGFDLAIRAGKLEDSSLVARKVGSADMVLVAAPSYLKRKGRPKTFDALAEHDWVLYRASGGRGTLTLKGPTETRSLELHGAINSDDLSFCRRAVIAGAGIGLVPVHAAFDSIRAGELETVMREWSNPGASLYVVLPSNRFVPRRVTLLRDFLVEQLTKQLSETQKVCESRKALLGATA